MEHFIHKLDLSERLLDHSNKKYLSYYIREQKETLIRISDGMPYILCTYYVPSEMVAMLDIECLYIERIVGLAVGCNLIRGIEDEGLSPDICSYHTAFLELIENKILPKPKHIIAARYPCNAAVDLCSHISGKYNIPIYYIEGVHLESDYKNVFQQLQKQIELKQDIQTTVKLSKEAFRLKKKIDDYRMAYPGIIPSSDCLKIFTIENSYGSQNAVELFQLVIRFICGKLKDYKEPGNGVKKVFWMGLIPLYNNNILEQAEKEVACKFIYEEMWMFGEYSIAEDDFWKTLADRVENNLFYQTNRRIDRLKNVMQRLNCDFAINLSQERCSFLPPKVKVIKNKLDSEHIPLFNIEDDVIRGNLSRDDFLHMIQKCLDTCKRG